MSVRASQSSSDALRQVDPIWFEIRREAEAIVAADPAVASFVYAAVLNHDTLEDAVVHRIAERLDNHVVSAEVIRCAFREALKENQELGEIIRCDIAAVYDRDPACERRIEPVLYFKGFHAIQTHRLAHALWKKGRKDFALYLQSRSSEVFQTDIHPAVPVGRSIFLDHATGLVVGGTAVIEDDVSILQDVTLGGTGKQSGDRHPKNSPRCAYRRRRQDSWQHRDRRELESCRGLGGAEAGAAAFERGRRPGAAHRQDRRRRRAGTSHGPDVRGRPSG